MIINVLLKNNYKSDRYIIVEQENSISLIVIVLINLVALLGRVNEQVDKLVGSERSQKEAGKRENQSDDDGGDGAAVELVRAPGPAAGTLKIVVLADVFLHGDKVAEIVLKGNSFDKKYEANGCNRITHAAAGVRLGGARACDMRNVCTSSIHLLFFFFPGSRVRRNKFVPGTRAADRRRCGRWCD